MTKNILLIVLTMLFSFNLIANEINQIKGQTYTIHSEELEDDVNIVIYDPFNVSKNEEVTIIFYIFGDFLFYSFSGALHYLSKEQLIIPKTVLVGINEITDKQINSYTKEYADFITHDLITSLLEKYTITNNCVLFGHSRATRLVAETMLYNSEYIRNFILSAPWLEREQLDALENLFKNQKDLISIFITQSEEDLERDFIRDANQDLIQRISKYNTNVSAKYQYFEAETHMSIPPLSFYYGVKYLLAN